MHTKASYIFLLFLSLLIFVSCSSDNEEPSGNPNEMAYICTKGICNDFYSVKSATDYTDGFEPDWEPGGDKSSKAVQDEPIYDSITGWWEVFRECSEGIITYCFAESVKFIDTLGNFQKEPDGLKRLFHKMDFTFGLDSLIMEGEHDFTFSGLELDSSRIDTSIIEGTADWSISMAELEYSNSILYNELKWLWNDDNPYCYNDYPESGSYSIVINGEWNATLFFDGTNIAEFEITDGDDIWEYIIDMETGQVTFVSGPA